MYKKHKIFEWIPFFLKMNIPVKAPAINYQTNIQKQLPLSSKTYSSFLEELESHFKIKISEPIKNNCKRVDQLTLDIEDRVRKAG